jgi:hypothetical protein
VRSSTNCFAVRDQALHGGLDTEEILEVEEGRILDGQQTAPAAPHHPAEAEISLEYLRIRDRVQVRFERAFREVQHALQAVE